MSLGEFSGHSPADVSAHRFGLALGCTSKPEGAALAKHGDPPAPAEVFLEIGLVLGAALGLAVILGLAV